MMVFSWTGTEQLINYKYHAAKCFLNFSKLKKILSLFSGVKCPPITLNANSTVQLTSPTTCQTTMKPTCEFQDIVVIACDTGYEMADGTTNSTLTCQDNRTYDKSSPTCQSKIFYFFCCIKSWNEWVCVLIPDKSNQSVL